MVLWLVMVLALGATDSEAPELAPEVAAGVYCELQKPLRISAKPRGRGKKTKLEVGAKVTVIEVERRWVYVRGDWDEGWVAERQLERRCGDMYKPTPVAQATASPTEGTAQGGTSPTPAAAPNTQLEALTFGAASGAMLPNAPEGTHLCSYANLEECVAQCRLGHAESCFLAAEQRRAQLPSGDVPPETYRRVAAFYTMACNRNHAESCVRLGEMYELGEGLPMSDPVVLRLYKGACAGGAPRACTHLGYMYLAGEGVAASPTEAAEYYRQGCDGGSPQGCVGLGSLLLSGAAGPADPVRAAQLFSQGCEGDARMGAEGCANLGYLYEVGQGVMADLNRAKELYQRGCAGGAAYACERLTALGVPLPEEPRGEAGDAAKANEAPQPLSSAP